MIISIVSEGSARILTSTVQFWHCKFQNVVLYQSTWYWSNLESNDEKGRVVKIFLEKYVKPKKPQLDIMAKSLSAW